MIVGKKVWCGLGNTYDC